MEPSQSDSPQSNTTDSSAPKANSSSNNTASIAGGVAGGVGGLAIIVAAAVYLYLRRRKRQEPSNVSLQSNHPLAPHDPSVTPHSLQEADTDAEYKGAQLEDRGIHELQQYPVEMAVRPGGARELSDQAERYEMGAAVQGKMI